MKKTLTAACAAILLASCAGIGSRTAPEETATAKAAEPTKQRITGGYSEQRALTDDEKALFEKATAELDGVRYTPESVSRQVVAGTNYRFICKAATATREPETYQAEVTVFQPLPGKGEARITKITRL